MGKDIYKRMSELDSDWEGCKRCSLSETRLNVVSWRGSISAKIFAIGEAPGRHEDEQGLPFVGRAGTALEKILVSAKLGQYPNVFIANLVGCRPPGNRVPTKEEVKACRPRLDAMLEIVKPRVIVTLGSTAAFYVAKAKHVLKWQGEEVVVEMWLDGGIVKIPVIITFHPSYFLRTGDKKVNDAMVSAFLKARKISVVDKTKISLE